MSLSDIRARSGTSRGPIWHTAADGEQASSLAGFADGYLGTNFGPQYGQVHAYNNGVVVGKITITVVIIVASMGNPCGSAGLLVRGANLYLLFQNARNLVIDVRAGNYGRAAIDAIGLVGNISQLGRVCFLRRARRC